ncbi:hypothetical protein BKA70DRAFT_1559633 [Coprinopsis sp. MPI-PUGE-AT-0042]|nr:hypothetical protein BKA70DRAFT_1559633 [Coprinopsis sp. MPI-PUGE-AT-0042]
MYPNTGFDALPYDIKQLILLELDSEKDLLHLGLTNKGWKDLIIPYHLEYRTLSLNRNRPEVWRHLAQKRHLASRIRTVVIGPEFMAPHDFGWEGSCGRKKEFEGHNQDVYPRAVGERGGPLPTSYGCKEVRKAFANMRSLETFRWEGPARTYDDLVDLGDYLSPPSSLPGFMLKVLEGLLEAKSIRNLCLRDPGAVVFGPQNGEAGKRDFPLWNLCDLESLSLNINCSFRSDIQEPTLTNLLKINLNSLTALQLNLRYVPDIVMDLTFPNLKTLSLTCDVLNPPPQLISYPRSAHIFLSGNPTIQDLDLQVPISLAFKLLPGRFLPNLQTIRLQGAGKSSFGFLMSMRAVHKPLLSLSGLALKEETMRTMIVHREALAGLKFLSIDSVDHPAMLMRLGTMLPNLVALRYRGRCSPIVLDLDEFVSLVSDLTALRALDGISVRVTSEQKQSLVDRISSAASCLEFASVITSSCDAAFKVDLARNIWEKVDGLDNLFIHDQADPITRYLPACPW